MVNAYIWRERRDITDKDQLQYTGYDRPSRRKCWEFLDLTSRSFAMVIKELEGDLARVVRQNVLTSDHIIWSGHFSRPSAGEGSC